MREESGRLDRGDGVELAWRRVAGCGPGVVFLGGFRSDMTGTKAEDLAAFCAETGRAFLRFDYSGHGASGGAFEAGSIGRWAADAEAAIGALTTGPQVLVGSSMGGWISLLLMRRRPEMVAGFVGIAAAPDFTLRIEAALTVEARAALEREGVWHRPSAYGDPYPITRGLLEDGRRQMVLDRALEFEGPVRLLQGQQDPDVPWDTALRIAEAVTGGDVQVVLVKDGDHRLSRAEDLRVLRRVVEEVMASPG
ncbi:carboxylesterase [Belnapia sp. F-4-1]|uniref:alpha/beta hydrolase n=1 Tax=Belnapia sp. F-4-1 TaxID=1545443 RepID=UPI0005B7E5A3|nr:alpha/beta hydrolase [Belnapia sp. F-4-1]